MKMEELNKDIIELESLKLQATQQRVKNILSVELNKLQNEATKLRQEYDTTSVQKSPPPVSNTPRSYQVKLNNYAWDQSSKFVKFYVTLPKVQLIASENITCKFTERSLELEVKDLENKNYVFTIKNLLYLIKPGDSTWKVKSDMILINAAKEAQKNWEFVTETEKRVSDSKKPSLPAHPDKSQDPSEGLMTLMKKMYEEGDDEMKRTIAKAFHENQAKSSQL